MKNEKCKMKNGGTRLRPHSSTPRGLPPAASTSILHFAFSIFHFAFSLLPSSLVPRLSPPSFLALDSRLSTLDSSRRPRRGVLLLIILGMLLMFGMIGIAFVMLTGHAQRGATAFSRMDRYEDPPEKLLNDAFLQVARGTTNPASVLRPHSLLEDIYGSSTATTVSAAADVAGGQLVNLTVAGATQRNAGCVLTMVNGPAAGQSTRIVGFNYAGGATVQVVALQGVSAADLNAFIAGNTLNVLINNPAFSGTGFGYDTTATAGNPLLTARSPGEDTNQNGVLDAGEDTNMNGTIDYQVPYALSPNAGAFEQNGYYGYTDPAGPGGANEDYDAVDYQNMLLAMQIPGAGHVPVPMPSLCRSELVWYWATHLNTVITWPGAFTDADKVTALMQPYGPDAVRDAGGEKGVSAADCDKLLNVKRKITLRPAREDHPKFTGSNPDFAGGSPGFDGSWDGNTGIDSNSDGLNDYRWDVDNDGDGVEDSIWVDLGMPARAGKDGRMYKPLFAILCVDLDGRLNLNAHGCLAQTDAEYYNAPTVTTAIYAGGLATPAAAIARGQGCGPAEINLLPIVNDDTAQYGQLLRGIPDDPATTTINESLDGRYGEKAGGLTVDPAAGRSEDNVANRQYANDLLSVNRELGFPAVSGNNFRSDYDPTSTTASGVYGSLLDLKGSWAIGLDLRGQPLLVNSASTVVPKVTVFIPDGSSSASSQPYFYVSTNDPYELDLSAKTARGQTPTSSSADNPFSPAELERLLRPYDIDAPRLPNRLETLAANLANHRNEITTESWDVPCPGPANIHTGATPPGETIRDMLIRKLTTGAAPLTLAQAVAALPNLLPPEVLAGLRMDLNRPFGNGQPGASGVIDDPNSTGAETVPLVDRTGAAVTPPFNYLNHAGAALAGDSLRARQLYARHLYVMMLTLMNYPPGGNAADARRVAQWAVNMVDFRDRDSIMTGFEYDVDPFTDDNTTKDDDPWDVDGDLTTDDHAIDPSVQRGVVWGCERPELLISETLAFHDRRTEDLPDDGGKIGDTDPDDHGDFDQQFKPQGSLFVELYNPWSNGEPGAGELYQNGGVAINAVNPGGSPVWRLAIVPGGDWNKDPDDPTNPLPPTIERTVYFVGPGASLPSDSSQVQFRPGAGYTAIAPIRPGRYAVIGPGEPGTSGTSTTDIGFKGTENPASHPSASRRIVLTPNANPEAPSPQVEVWTDPTKPKDDLASLTIQPAVAVVINEPQRLSISEPYSTPPYTAGIQYPAVLPQPVDRLSNPAWDAAWNNNGTTPRARVVHLQRLANPLLAYNAQTNPYLTIDSAGIDLTSFNGIDKGMDPLSGVTSLDIAILTRERGDNNDVAGQHNLWTQEPLATTPASLPNGASAVPGYTFDEPIHHTLGYVNREYTQAAGPIDSADNAYDGSPQSPPFPWLTWNNRPYASPLELLQVPAVDPYRLLKYPAPPDERGFGMCAPSASRNAYDPFTSGNFDRTKGPFPHLIDFFYDSGSGGMNWQLYRLLDFVNVPSRFAGTTIQGDPATFAAATGHSFYPPFNQIPTYREPGKVNINTVFTHDVWQGLMNYFPTMDTATFFDDEFVRSRRGYGAAGNNQLTMDATLPTRFANPFRSPAAADLVPIAPLQPNGLLPKHNYEVNVSLLREHPANAGHPLFESASTAAVNDTDRNAYFYYQGLQRLGNLVTTRSNVYAVWITVGYFEVEPWKDDSTGHDIDTRQLAADYQLTHPDGYKLGKELGTDTGEVKRHRAFFIFDRSIPMGFQRGKDLNVEKGVLIRRFVE